MDPIEILILLLAIVVVLVAAAKRLHVPYPIVLLLGGLVLGFVPHLPKFELTPELVFLLFLPPLLQAEAWFTSWRELRRNARPIGLLAIGLVFATTIVVAYVVHAVVPGVSLPVAIVLGAVCAPTDAVAVAAVAQRLRVPQRVLTILSGESLINDATALVVYRTALLAVADGVFSPGHATFEFFRASLGGILVGFIVAYLVSFVLKRTNDTTLGITISLVAAWLSYLPAEHLHLSGVLAVVTSGIYLGRQATFILSPQQRMQGIAFWEVLVFILNGLLFIMVGLQLHEITREFPIDRLPSLFRLAATVSLTVVSVRVVWVFLSAYLPRKLVPGLRVREEVPTWQNVSVIAWAGARGGVSLASALAIPLKVHVGTPQEAPFPHRELILFLTFGVIFTTLVLQGLSLPPIIRWLNLQVDDTVEKEERYARFTAVRAARQRLDQLKEEANLPADIIEEVRKFYLKRTAHLDGDATDEEREELNARRARYMELKQILINTERAVVIKLRDNDTISDDALQRVQRDLDLDEVRLSPPGGE